MKNIVILIVFFVATFNNWGFILNDNDVIILNQKTVDAASAQLDYLYEYNKDIPENQKWFILFLGKEKTQLEQWLNEDYEHLDVSKSNWVFDSETLRKINESLISINKQKDFASYAIITDAESEIVIPTSPIYATETGKFLDELEKKLITATLTELELQFEQRASFKQIESKIRASSDYKSKWIQDAVDSVLANATKFKNSAKKFKILHYSVITKLHFLKQGSTEVTIDNLTTVDTQVHGTRSISDGNPNLDFTTIKALRNTFYESLSEYNGHEKFMLARVLSYQKYLEGKDLNVPGLKEGFGKKVYVVQQEKTSNEEEQEALLNLCNFLSDEFNEQTISDRFEVIVDLETVESGKDRVNLLESIIKNGIIEKESLLELYPYYGVARQYENGLNQMRVYFSSFNLWTKTGDISSHDTIEANYNDQSVDFVVSKGKTVKSKYFYSLSDLIVRYRFITSQGSNNFITQEILRTEQKGMAFSIAQKEHYDQYVAKWGTDSAFIFIAYWSAQWAHDLAAAHFARQLAFEYGAFLIEEIAKQLGKELFKKVVRDYGKDALKGALIDYGVQSAFNYILNDNITSFSEAASPGNINWISVAWSAGENTIRYKNLLTEFGVSGAGACLINGLSEAGGFKNDFDYQSCAVNIGITYGIKVIFKVGASPFLRKQAVEALKKGKDRLRRILVQKGIPEDKADEFIESIKKAADDSEDGNVGTSSGQKINALGKTDNPIDNISKNSQNNNEVLEELTITNKISSNNPVTDTFKKFWSQHEFNVTKYLEKSFGRTNIGRQITIDIFIKGKGKVTCRVDNLIRQNNGKFKIVDAKSSITQDLSAKEVNSIVNSLTTKNQKAFYEAIKSGSIEKIVPRGARAIEYFSKFKEFEEALPINLNIERTIDFFVNDISEEGYNIFKMIFK